MRLECPACGSALQGNFTLGRLARLTREQLQFVEVFIRCRGKIKDVEEELGISYPTVVGRLNEVVQAMGFEVRQEDAHHEHVCEPEAAAGEHLLQIRQHLPRLGLNAFWIRGVLGEAVER